MHFERFPIYTTPLTLVVYWYLYMCIYYTLARYIHLIVHVFHTTGGVERFCSLMLDHLYRVIPTCRVILYSECVVYLCYDT